MTRPHIHAACIPCIRFGISLSLSLSLPFENSFSIFQSFFRASRKITCDFLWIYYESQQRRLDKLIIFYQFLMIDNKCIDGFFLNFCKCILNKCSCVFLNRKCNKNWFKKWKKNKDTARRDCFQLLNPLELRIKFRITLIPITGEKPYSSLITSIEYWKFPNLIIFPVPETNSIGQCSPRANEQTKSVLSEIAGFFSAWKRSIERKFSFHNVS